MLVHVKELLSKDALQRCSQLLGKAEWADGGHTAGTQSNKVKNNRQLPETASQLPELRRLVMEHLQKNGLFFSAALPRRVLSAAAWFDCRMRGGKAKLTPDRVGYMCHPDWVSRPDKVPPAELWRAEIATCDGLIATAAWYREHGWL